jgi:hypothetical protein
MCQNSQSTLPALLPTDMTDTEIQIAIAECCGWIPHAWRIRLSNEEAMVMIQAKKKTQSG